MNFIQNLISDEMIYALGWTMVHSLWQGILIAFVMALALFFLQKRSAKIRYEVAGLSLFLVFVSAICTFLLLFEKASQVPLETLLLTDGPNNAPAATAPTSFLQHYLAMATGYFNEHMPLIVTLWLVGVAFFMLRLMGGLAYVQRLRYRHNAPLAAPWQKQLQILLQRIPVRRKVTLLESAMVRVPMVIGFVKPVILMPLGAVNGLTAKEVEAILAHELAHILRNDYLTNILLSFIEVLFYYHPAVWWISANVRNERENCADDIAIKVCGNSLAYARALVSLQEINPAIPAFAMSFSGPKNQLLKRISRILNQPQTRSNILEKLTATGMLLVAILFLSVSAGKTTRGNDATETPVKKMITFFYPDDNNENELLQQRDTVPDKQKTVRQRIIKKEDDQEIELEMSNGAIQTLKINGEIIPEENYGKHADLIEELTQNMHQTPPLPPAAPPPPGAPRPPVPPAPPAFPNKKMKVITSEKGAAGETIIMIDGDDGETMEIIVNNSDDLIFIDGAAMENGDTVIIMKQKGNAPFFNWQGQPFDANSFQFNFPDSLFEGPVFHFDHNEGFPPGLMWQSEEGAMTPNFQFFSDDNWTEELKDEMKRLQSEMNALQKQQLHESQEHREELQEELEQRRAEMDELRQQMEEQQRARFDEARALAEEHRQQARELREEARAQMEERREASRAQQEELSARDEERRTEMRQQREESTKRLKGLLIQDGLIKPGEGFSFQLNNDTLKVNGKKQSPELHKKYLAFYGKENGLNLDGNFNIQINEN